MTRAVILAAGQGMRLRPHTDDRPKCMVELAGKPLLYRQLGVLHEAGIQEILVIGGYRADRLPTGLFELERNPRYDATNMVATLFCAEHWLRSDQDLLICYGDIVYEPKVLRALLTEDAPVAISVDRAWRRFWEVRMDDPLSDAETLKLDANGRVLELGKKPRDYAEIQGQYMGLIKVRADHVGTIVKAWHELDRHATYDGKDFDNMYMTSFLQHLIDNGIEVTAAPVDNGWLEVDTVEDLALYHQMQQEGTLRAFCDLQD